MAPTGRTALATLTRLALPVLLAWGLSACQDDPVAGDTSVVVTRSPLTGFKFGVTNQQGFQNSWRQTLGYSNENSNEFGSEFDNNNAWSWWLDLQGGKPWLENTLDQVEGGIDSVHFLYSYTHGEISGDGATARLAMWDQNTFADSVNMRLGDESAGLGAWASWSCSTLKFNDGLLPNRWGPAFAGGLYMIMASHDLVWWSWLTSDVGEEVAENLNDGDLLWHSWVDGMSDWDDTEDVAVATTGRYPEDCYWRFDNARWPGVMNFGRLRDSDVQFYCWSYWDNL